MFARIEIVEFPDEDGTDFTEKVFAGPLIDQVRASLRYIKNMYITEKVHKVEDRAEAERWFNYPYSAIEESLINAVYHRSYQENAPVEVRVYPSRIEILSYPGPMPPLNNKNIGKISCRRYRNSRIGGIKKGTGKNVYHGKPKWSISKQFISLFEEPSDMEDFIPDFKYNLYDISHMSDGEIRGTPLLKIFLTTFKYIYSPELKKKLMDIFRLFLELSDKTKVSEYLEVLLRYLFNSPGEYSKEEIREQVTNILERGGDVMQTIAQQLREEGIKIGEKIGKEDNAKETAIRMLKKGFDINTIVEITGLEPSVIEKLRKPYQ